MRRERRGAGVAMPTTIEVKAAWAGRNSPWCGLDSAPPAATHLHSFGAPLGRRAVKPFRPGGSAAAPPEEPPSRNRADALGRSAAVVNA